MKEGLDKIIGKALMIDLYEKSRGLLRRAFEASQETHVDIDKGEYTAKRWIYTYDREESFVAKFLTHYGLLVPAGQTDSYEITEKGKRIFDKYIRKKGEVIGLLEQSHEIIKKYWR